MNRSPIIHIICFLIISISALGQISFSHIGIDEGLSQSTVFDITQDNRGNMWFATLNGVNKFDGYNFTVYRHEEGMQNSIAHNTIRIVEAGSKGKVWVGTDEGLSCYNPEEDFFYNYHYEKEGRRATVTGLVEIDPEHLLVNTSEGLVLFDIPNTVFTTETLNSALFQLKATAIHRCNDQVYIGSAEGVFVYSLSDHTLRMLFSGQQNQKEVLTILQQSDTQLWIGTEGNGLFLINPETKETKHYTAKDKNGISSDFVRSLALDSLNRLWVGTFTSLDIYDEQHDLFTAYVSNRLQHQSLSQSSIRSIFKDSQGGMWLGTYFGGVNYHHPLKERFGHLQFMPYLNSLNDNIIGCITEDKSGSLWIGTNSGGVNLYNPVSGTFSYYTKKEGLGANDVKAIYVDETANKVYIGTHSGGLNVLNRHTGRIENYTSGNSSLTNDNVYAILPSAGGGQLWIGTLNALMRFDPAQSKFTEVTTDATGKPLKKNRIRELAYDSQQRLWIGGEDGLSVYTCREGELTACPLLPENTGLENAYINCIYETADGIFWLGSRNGLYKLDEKKKEVKRYTVSDGLPDPVVYGILEDHFGRLWLSTDKGLSCFLSGTGMFRNYTAIDGLQSNQFTPQAHCRTASGELFFGGINGITTFHPERMKDNPYTPSAVITYMKLFNVPVRPHDKTGILTKQISETGQIRLKNEQSSFTLEFVVSNYIAGQHNTFAYKLEGYDADWYYADERHPWATYANLPHGDYRFLVKAANNDGKWNETPTVLEISILPAWYQTWWARTLFLLLVLAIIVLVFRYQMERVDKEKQKELQEMKMRFFINISHELRTPLTLILAPLQEILDKVTDKWTRNQLEYIKRNANRLLHLVNQLMDYRRAEQGVFELNVKPNEVHQLVESNFRFYEHLARKKRIDYNLCSELENKKICCDSSYIELILNNLLSNAFKYTNAGQSITVHLKEEGAFLLVQVKDTGIGIPVDKQARIFERFYQVENEHMGSGIGLSLVQKLVELHHGRIELESAENTGSCFSIYLPASESAYSAEELSGNKAKQGEQAYSTNVKDMYMVDTEQPETGQQQVEVETRGKKETILIVEDNDEVQQYLSDELSESYVILEAGNGEEALEILKENAVDLILTDVMMPVMNGIQLCKNIKQNLKTCHIPVIILSAKSELKEQMEGLQVGADDYISKPFSLSFVVTKIKNMLRTRYRSIEHYSNSLEIEPEKIAMNPLDEEFLKKAMSIVENHLDDVEFSADGFSGELNMSRSSLHMKMKAVTGESTTEFIRKIRFSHACKLLKEGRYNVAEISTMVGFNTPSYFATSFKKYRGCLPSEYAKNGDV